ncbi:hypothetical protein, partial [uncultured Lamprocystis sp.]|uniref:hypothetical protein n=1 Tax=uncultured Lamprocystis sp. TaxID=543132 RepID=UPI0025E859F0
IVEVIGYKERKYRPNCQRIRQLAPTLPACYPPASFSRTLRCRVLEQSKGFRHVSGMSGHR